MPSSRRTSIVAAVEQRACDQHGVIARADARRLGADRRLVRSEVKAGRWVTRGQRTICTHRGELTQEGTWALALIETGPRAALDGATALRAAGLEGFEDRLQVSVPHGIRHGSPDDVRVRELLAWNEDQVIDAGLRRVRPIVAAVRAAAWARTDRQAALVLLMTVQQRLARPADLLDRARSVVRLSRREFIEGVLTEAVDGVQALGELDFAKLCRQRGLPEPSRQVVRRRPSGRAYLDVAWEALGIVVEIDGIHHLRAMNDVDDALRQNEVTLRADTVLRIPSIALRIDPQPFMDQVERLVRARMQAA